ncbi:MAG TPA: hypothetical protein DCM62_04005 [Bacteroidales bacterium]|nr:hypothetical protein [Bacteroidales bacterium]
MAKKESNRPVLSKSTFIRGLQCEKSLYLHKNRPFLRDPLPEWQQAKFTRGTKVGVIARNLYPDGRDATPKTHFQMADSAQKTMEWIEMGTQTIYEAAFVAENVVVALDILVQKPEGWIAIEVKSSLSISGTYLWDATLQYYVITSSGIALHDFFIATINPNYIRQGALEPQKLFVQTSVLAEIQERLPLIANKIQQLKEVTRLNTSPDISIGKHCYKPYPCDFIGHCWKNIKPPSVFDLLDLDLDQQHLLYGKGYLKAADVPATALPSPLSAKHQQSIIKKQPIVESEKLAEFLASLNRSMAFCTCFSVQPALPLLQMSTPYSTIPVLVGILPVNSQNHIPQWFVLDYRHNEASSKKLLESLAALDTAVVFHQEAELANAIAFVSNSLSNKDMELLPTPKIVDLKTLFSGHGLYWSQMSKSKSAHQILSDFHEKPVGNIPKGMYKQKEAIMQVMAENSALTHQPEVLMEVIAQENAHLLNLEKLHQLLLRLSEDV